MAQNACGHVTSWAPAIMVVLCVLTLQGCEQDGAQTTPGQAESGQAAPVGKPPAPGVGKVRPSGPGQTPPSGPGQMPPTGNLGGAPASSSDHAAPLLGDVAKTTVSGTDARTGASFPVGENIYGPFEAGFGSQQDHILESLGCAQGSLGHVAGGLDTQVAEQMVAYQCGITLPRIEGQSYISLLDECGGHTREYHFHEKLTCLYDGLSGAHSPKVGTVQDGKSLYGMWEHTAEKTSPLLDACGGHLGKTPESPEADVYHYHVQGDAPFTVGCFGPNDDGSMVTVEQCRSFYGGCDSNLVTVTTPQGTKEYDDWCPCFDASGSNSGKNIVPLAVFSATTAAPLLRGAASQR